MDRLDRYMHKQGLVKSRNQAVSLIKSGAVTVDGKVVLKPATAIDGAEVMINDKIYISRAGKKLELFLREYPYDIKDKHCLDAGSSTGGFVQILLEMGAKEVVAVDVGKDQLDKTLLQDSRVKAYQECDIRSFESDVQYDLVTCDLSFISIKHVFDKLLSLAKSDMILLFKPQFEVGKEAKRDKKGVVKDLKLIEQSIVKFETVVMQSCEIVQKSRSQLSGKEGNVEWFYHVKKY